MNYCPPEYIIEEYNGRNFCIIYDPPSGGEYFCFEIFHYQSIESIKMRIKQALNSAAHEIDRALGIF